MNSAIVLRLETSADYSAVETLTREAFWNLHGPCCDEYYLVHILRDADVFIPELDYVAEMDGRIVGNIMYAQSHIELDTGGTLPVITFGPLSVKPEFQGQGIGRTLIKHTLSLARHMEYHDVFIYGDPAYYGRLGFLPAQRFGVATDDNFYHAALQAFALKTDALQNINGRFIEASVYHINEVDAAAFDQTFPAKEKLSGTLSQQRFQEVVAMRRPRG